MAYCLVEMAKRTEKNFPVDIFKIKSRFAEILAPMPDFQYFQQQRSEMCRTSETADPELRHLYLEPLLTKEQEQHLFRQMNFHKYQAQRACRQRIPLAERVIETQKQFCLYTDIQQMIAASNLRLVANLSKKQKEYYDSQNMDVFLQLISDGNIGLMRAIDYFDWRRNLKFSTYATYAIWDMLNRNRPHRTSKAKTNLDDDTLLLQPDERFDESKHREDGMFINNMLKDLNDRQRRVLIAIYRDGKKLKSIARDEHISKERVRQIKVSALKFLRQTVNPESAGFFGKEIA